MVSYIFSTNHLHVVLGVCWISNFMDTETKIFMVRIQKYSKCLKRWTCPDFWHTKTIRFWIIQILDTSLDRFIWKPVWNPDTRISESDVRFLVIYCMLLRSPLQLKFNFATERRGASSSRWTSWSSINRTGQVQAGSDQTRRKASRRIWVLQRKIWQRNPDFECKTGRISKPGLFIKMNSNHLYPNL